MGKTSALERLMQASNIVSQNFVLRYNIESFNIEIIYSREPKQPPKEMHHCGTFGCAFIQHGNSTCVITINKNAFVAPGVTPSSCRDDNTDNFLIINVEVKKTID